MKWRVFLLAVLALILSAGALLAFDDDMIDAVSENLVEDDGSFEAFYPVLHDAYIVSCIAPDNYPSFLTAISEEISNLFGENTQVAVFTDADGDGPDGDPVWTFAEFAPPHREWFSRDLTAIAAFDVPITEGSWCIGFRQIGYFVFELQDTSSSYGHTWTGRSDTGWVNLDAISLEGNGAFRGVASYEPENCACVIDDLCYAAYETNPANVCLFCDPDESITSWSDNDGAVCADAYFCNGEDTCQSGLCSQHAGNPCPVDDNIYCNGDETYQCFEATDQCGHTGNPCPVDDGLFCNGDETAECVESEDECGHTGNPCDETEECLESIDQCVPLVDDDTTDDDTTDDDITDDDATDDDATDDDATDDDATDDDATDDDATDDDATDDDATDDDATDDDATDDDATDDDAADDDASDDDTLDDDTAEDDDLIADDDTDLPSSNTDDGSSSGECGC